MKKRNQAVERLRATNPVDETDLEGPNSPRAQSLLEEVLGSPRQSQSPFPWDRSRIRRTVAVTVIAVVSIAAAWVWTLRIATPEAVSCYQAVDLDSDIAAAPAGESATADACAPVWKEGILVNSDIAPARTVPPLTACVASNGSLAVFPTGDTSVCSRLGLAYPDPENQPEADLIRDVQDQLISMFQTQECLTIKTAAEEVRQILDSSGLTEWIIQTQPPNPDRPCASHSFDADSQTVILVPIPRD